MPAPLKILIAPLDWGLGHTTRCIPLIRFFRQRGDRVIAAAEGASAALLRDNFNDLEILPLEGYRIRYSRSARGFAFRIVAQVPRIFSAIRKERRWLAAQQQAHAFDLVLSDNRYGMYHKGVPSVILTHQLQIQSGFGAWADKILRRLHYRMLGRFSACWVVDTAAGSGLSGALAHPEALPPHAAYIGLLSQFGEHKPSSEAPLPGNILVLLSGPEPMRSQLEQLVLRQARSLPAYRYVIVAGRPGAVPPAALPEHITYHAHANAQALSALLAHAALVICRSGYSTLMDLAVLKKKALLIPTPGQTEQEYLARYLAAGGMGHSVKQEQLRLSADIPRALSGSRPLQLPDNAPTLAQVLPPLLGNLLPRRRDQEASFTR